MMGGSHRVWLKTAMGIRQHGRHGDLSLSTERCDEKQGLYGGFVKPFKT